jgi:hypothetical protein
MHSFRQALPFQMLQSTWIGVGEKRPRLLDVGRLKVAHHDRRAGKNGADEALAAAAAVTVRRLDDHACPCLLETGQVYF